MRPVWHVVAAAGLGTFVYQVTQSWQLAIGSASTEVLLDIDHVIEHLAWSDRPFCLRNFLSRYSTFARPRVVYVFHSYELIALLAVLAWYFAIPFLWVIILGAIVHILLDEIGNRLPAAPGHISPGFYCFSYRALRKFRTDAIITWPEKITHQMDDEVVI